MAVIETKRDQADLSDCLPSMVSVVLTIIQIKQTTMKSILETKLSQKVARFVISAKSSLS